MQNLIGLTAGADSGWFEIIHASPPVKEEYWPSIDDDGNRLSLLRDGFEKCLKYKRTMYRTVVVLTVRGNAIACEEFLKDEKNMNCVSTSPHTVTIIYGEKWNQEEWQ